MPKEIRTSTGIMRAIKTSNSNTVMYDTDHSLPSFEVPIKSIPEAEEWEIGKEYNLEIKVKQKRLSEEDGQKLVKFCVLKLKPL